MVYKSGSQIIYWSWARRENYFNYLNNLAKIKELGFVILGVTSDKHPSIVSAVKTMISDVPHQYCLVHIQRRCQSLLTKNPKTQAGEDLRDLVININKIRNHYEKDIWINWLFRYEERYLDFINQRTYATTDDGKRTWWYTHRNVRSAFRLLRGSLENMFLYLDYPGLCKDTNGLEGEFSHLKRKVGLHRGLRRDRKRNLVLWYLFFKSQERESN